MVYPQAGAGAGTTLRRIVSLDSMSNNKMTHMTAPHHNTVTPPRGSVVPYVAPSCSMSSNTGSHSSSSGSSISPMKLFTDSSPRKTPSPPSSTVSPNKTTRSTQPESPTTIMVNLNAKHFSGTRRDRMRPSNRGGGTMARKNSAPSLLQLGSLPGGSPTADSNCMSCDSTCAPSYGSPNLPHNHSGGSGGSSSNGEGGLRHSWSSFDSTSNSSSADYSLEYNNSYNAKPPPYATPTTAHSPGSGSARLGGGMTMRLRGVDP